MQTAANQLRTPDDLPVESATPDDVGSIAPSYTPGEPQQGQQPQQGEAEDKADPPQWRDEKRAEIFARAREKRAQEVEPFDGDANDPNALYGANVDTSEMGELEKEALRVRQERLAALTGQQPQQPQQGQQGQQPQQQGRPLNGIDPTLLSATVPIVVDGEQRLVTVEEALRNYQIEEAAKRRLEQAKALLAHSQEFQRVQQPQPGQPRAEYNEPSGQDDSRGDLEELDRFHGNTSRMPQNLEDLVEKIQLGSKDEAGQALIEAISTVVNRSAPVDETTRVLTALENANAEKAVRAFGEKNPHLASDPVLQMAATREIHEAMAQDLFRAGYTRDQLIQLAPNTQALTQLHKEARIKQVRGVRQVSELLDVGYQSAVNKLRSLVDQAAPQAPSNQMSMQQRQQRKESLQPQPVARRLSVGSASSQQQRTVEQSRADAFAKMKRARGQSG